MNLDHFKEMNDIGDKLLQEVARRVLRNIRAEDVFAQLSGDEFVLIFTSVHKEKLHRLVEKAIGMFRRPWIIDGVDLPTTASMGVVIYPDDAENEADLMKKADTAMYKSKGTWA